MGLLKNLISGMGKDKTEFKEKFRAAQEEKKINDLIEERSKSSNRRELERIMRDKEEEKIKTMLQQVRKKENKELWKSKNMVLEKGSSILKDDRPILKEKNVFMNQTKIPFTKGGENMFFKF